MPFFDFALPGMRSSQLSGAYRFGRANSPTTHVFGQSSINLGTRQIPIEAAQHLSSSIPNIILVDGGSENRVEIYGDTLQWVKERMRRALANIAYSNSMIEAFSRKIKYPFLFKYNHAMFENANDIVRMIVGVAATKSTKP